MARHTEKEKAVAAMLVSLWDAAKKVNESGYYEHSTKPVMSNFWAAFHALATAAEMLGYMIEVENRLVTKSEGVSSIRTTYISMVSLTRIEDYQTIAKCDKNGFDWL